MNLKEAFTYQNFYDRLIGQVESYFSTNSTYTRTFTHRKNEVNPEAENVVKVEVQQEKLPYSVDTMISFALNVMAEKEAMYAAIRKAKESMSFDMDAAIGMNKLRNRFRAMLELRLYNKKDVERVTEGRDYKFNVNGEQVPYTYEIDEKLTLEYDRKKVKQVMKSLDAASNDASRMVDQLNVNLEVDITPKYTLDMDLEECLERFTTDTEAYCVSVWVE